MRPSSSHRDAIDETGLTRQLVATALAVDGCALPAAIVERAKDLIVDHVGVAIRGSSEPWTRIVREQVLAEDAAPVSSLYGGGLSSARNAALVNGTAAHALELDDTHDRSLTHPGAVVIAAALATAQATGAGGTAMIAAIVAGYETQCRLGIHLGQAMIERGVHPTAALGVFGAVAAAGRLLALDERSLTCAFGIAASMSAGLMQFSQDPSGTMVKRLYGGLPAERGVLAAQLASAGYTGPRASIEGMFGVARVLAGRAITELRETGRDSGYQIAEVSIKLHACCRNFHALIDAVRYCRQQRVFGADDIEGIEVHGPRAMIDHHLEQRPSSTMAAQYSLPFTTAVALLSDTTTPSSFQPDQLERLDLLTVADRIVSVYDAEFEAAFPAHFGGGISIRFRDGTRLSRRVLDSEGTPAKPANRSTVHSKFRAMTTGALNDGEQQGLLAAIATLDQAGSLEALNAALAGPTAQSARVPAGYGA